VPADTPAALSLPELLAVLAGDYAERTVRRWLLAFIAQGVVEKTGQKRSSRYALVTKAAIPVKAAGDKA
jgi:hypothetical protein